jgi:hypothetical protein
LKSDLERVDVFDFTEPKSTNDRTQWFLEQARWNCLRKDISRIDPTLILTEARVIVVENVAVFYDLGITREVIRLAGGASFFLLANRNYFNIEDRQLALFVKDNDGFKFVNYLAVHLDDLL